MTATLLVIALCCLVAGAGTDLVLGTARRSLRLVPYLLALMASGLLLVAGVRVLTGRARTYDLGSLLGAGTTTVNLDDLAALFLTLLYAIALAVSFCSISWVRREKSPRRRGIGAAYCALLGSVAAILVSGDTFSFLFSWEVLTISFYVLAGVSRSRRRDARAAWLTLVTGKVSGACLLFGFLLLAGSSGSFSLAAWSNVPPGVLHDAAYALVVTGFAAKLGIVPFQGWMPLGYPAAPGPTRAAMAGIAANVGVYGLWRFLSILGPPPAWLVVVVLLLGGITSLLGIAFAGVQSRLSRVVAYSSVENAGIIFTAFGVALAGAASGEPLLEAAGLLAATLQVVAHAIAKSVLFVATANLEQARASDDLEMLRGVGRALPISGGAFAAGALSLAGLPPSIGFVSEWFVLEALMQEFRLPGLSIRLAMAGAGALVALSAGLATLAVVRILGLVLLGPRPTRLSKDNERGLAGRVGLGALGLSCFTLAAVSPLEVRYIANGLSAVVAKTLVEQALKSPWVLQPSYRGFSILSPSWMYLAMPVAFLAVALLALGLSRGRYFRVRRVPAWHSATSGVNGPASYSAFAFANPLRHVLANILGTRQEVRLLEPATAGERDRDSPGSEASARDQGATTYSIRVVEPVEHYLYRPVRTGMLAFSRLLERLQSGRLEAYVAYMLFAVLVALAIVAGMH